MTVLDDTEIDAPTPAPLDNLVRAAFVDRAATIVRSEGSLPKLHGYFTTFNRWYEVDSWYEGQFLERMAPGSIRRSLKENRDRIKILYDHGYDPQLGNKPLGPWDAREDDFGGYYEVDLIDTDYNRGFVIPAAEAGLLGSSFRFRVTKESWVEPKAKTKHNPNKLRERTIEDVELYEFGPVTFPANPSVGAVGIRATTDEWLDRLATDPLFVARMATRIGGGRVEALISSLPDIVRGESNQQPSSEVSDHVRAKGFQLEVARATRNAQRSRT